MWKKSDWGEGRKDGLHLHETQKNLFDVDTRVADADGREDRNTSSLSLGVLVETDLALVFDELYDKGFQYTT